MQNDGLIDIERTVLEKYDNLMRILKGLGRSKSYRASSGTHLAAFDSPFYMTSTLIFL